jgi:hypothetical protein
MCSRRGLGSQQRIRQEGFEEWTPAFPSRFDFNRVLEAALHYAEVLRTRAATAADFPSPTFEETDESIFYSACFQDETKLSWT